MITNPTDNAPSVAAPTVCPTRPGPNTAGGKAPPAPIESASPLRSTCYARRVIGHVKPCMTEISLHIDARMADYIRHARRIGNWYSLLFNLGPAGTPQRVETVPIQQSMEPPRYLAQHRVEFSLRVLVRLRA